MAIKCQGFMTKPWAACRCPTTNCSLGWAGAGKPGWSLEVKAVMGIRLIRG